MLGEKLLSNFSEYDLTEVRRTISDLSSLCSELKTLEKNKASKEVIQAKWRKLFKLSKELDYIFFED